MRNRHITQYNQVKGVRVQLGVTEGIEKEIIFDEDFTYLRLELKESSPVALLINNSKEEDYILVTDSVELRDLSINKVRLKLIEIDRDEVNMQLILMK